MINAILTGIFKIVTSLVGVLLSPINELIKTYLPDLTNIIGVVNRSFEYLFYSVGWWKDALLLSTETISFIILVITARLTLPFIISTVKLAIKWFDKLKP